MTELSPNEKKVLLAVKDDCITPEKIGEKTGLEMVAVMSAASWLKSKGLVEIKEEAVANYSVSEEGEKYIKEGLPERKVTEYLSEYNFRAPVNDILKKFDKNELAVAIKWIKGWGFGKIDKDQLIIEKPSLLINNRKEVEKFLAQIKNKGEVKEKDYPAQSKEYDYLQELKERRLVLWGMHFGRWIALTSSGKEIVERGIKIVEETGQLTPEIIQTGEWNKKKFRRYDVSTFSPSVYPGKIHPLTKIIDEIREIFVSMGFREIEYNYVQPCLWNMDALFVPQDHPARDMQDTFYIDGKMRVDKKIARKIKKIHENGGNTGSDGWGIAWDMDEAEKTVLRTHTTVNTIRYLSEHPEPPLKVFTVGRNFRRENIDSTHLPEFTQIEGIVMEKSANFNMLVGILKEFYKRIGFEKINLRPSYFPFTEPSLEVIVEYEGKILEMGGAGIFRPEVIAPFNVKHPVLAWGLGLERLAMIRLGLKDIRALYMSDIEWLRRV
ncbi:MAG: phenylalanine--tRNA ligase subunit alpha [Thermoplasmatales archaeon]|nr:phenylalanine--tRNA ligase subunit alpha [Thermoplasmatales archaeon]